MKRMILIKVLVVLTIIIASGAIRLAIAGGAKQLPLHYESVFSEFRSNDGVLQGWHSVENRWIKVPSRQRGASLDMSALQRIAVVPSNGSFGSSDKATELFSDDFSVGDCPHCSGAPSFENGTTWRSWDNSYDPLFGDTEVIWGVTCVRSRSGPSSAWCSKWERLCDPQDCADPDSTMWVCRDSGGGLIAANEVDTDMSLASPIDWPENLPTNLQFYAWQGLDPDNTELSYLDYLSIDLYDPEYGTYHPIATIWEYQPQWTGYDMTLPSEEVFGSSFKVVFRYVCYYNWSNNAGVFIDDVAISSSDVDLAINYAMTDGVHFSTEEPVTVTVSIRNNGSDPSVPCNLAYVQNGDMPSIWDPDPQYTGLVPVPAISPTSSIDVVFPVHYADGADGKTGSTTITHDLSFRIDSSYEVPETDEYNNDLWHGASASWSVMLPPIVLIHGYMGGGLVKDGDAVYSEDLLTTLRTMTLETNRIARDASTDYEADGGLMTVPGAYPPESGFMRNVDAVLLNPVAGVNTGLAQFPGVYIAPEANMNMWDPLIDNLLQQHGYEMGYDLFLFNYDWRKDLSPTHVLPDDLTPTVTRLDSLVHHIRDVVQHPGSERLTVISHSLGGLVAQAYMRWNSADHGVFRWIALGVPFQGTVDAFSGLYSANAGPVASIPVIGDLISASAARRTADLVQEFVPHWELLPTPHFDGNAPAVPGIWEGPEIFADAGVYPANMRRISIPAYPQYSCDNVEQNYGGCCWNESWKHNDYSRQWSNFFQRDYMGMQGGDMITDVDTWLLVCPNLPTLRGVARYEKESWFWPSWIPSSLRYSTKYDVFFSDGDGTVPAWSAATVNAEQVHTRYCNIIRHREMVQNQDVADFLTAIVTDQSLTWYDDDFPTDPQQILNPFYDNGRAWLIDWRLDTAVWQQQGMRTYSELPVYPITIELIDRNTGQMLVGTTRVASTSDPDGEIVPLVLDHRFKGLSVGHQLMIGSNCMEPMSLRLVIRPSPELFVPEDVPAAKDSAIPVDAEFTILGQLAIHDINYTWLFPDLDQVGDEFLEFNRLSSYGATYGFQAYVNFEIIGGDIQESELDLHVDSDGDGEEDYIVTRVDPEGTPLLMQPLLTASPNPFNPVTEIRWQLPDATGATLVIYDVTGRVVKHYDLGGRQEGSWLWDGRDGSGRNVPSGVYFAALQNAGFRRLALQKLTLIR